MVAIMMNKITVGIAGTACLLTLAACDSTYTPGMHGADAAQTGSLLSGSDTGANPNGGIGDPSISTNGHSPGGR